MIIEALQDSTHWTYKSGLGVDNPCLTEINGEIVVYFKAKTEEIEGHTGKAKYSYAKAKILRGLMLCRMEPLLITILTWRMQLVSQ